MPQLATSSSRAWTFLRSARYFAIVWPVLLILAGSNTVIRSSVRPPRASSTHSRITLRLPSVEQNIQYHVSLIRDNLPAYLDFVGTEVLPVMNKNVDDIVHDLNGLTEIKPGLFYHGHIDYSIHVSGGIEGLMAMNNLVLQYHTLENPLIYIPYWRQELGNLHDQDIDAWLERINEYNGAISTPGAASGVPFTPLTKYEVANIASSWDDYRRQNGFASPGLEMLTNMVYLIDGGKQPFYQDAFKNIYRFHSIVFSAEGYLRLGNRTHLENTFSPFQIAFEHIGACQVLLPVFAEASALNFGYILNLSNRYVMPYPKLLHNSAMATLNMSVNNAIRALPDDNLIKISSTPKSQWIALYAVGDYIFAVFGSLDSPAIFN